MHKLNDISSALYEKVKDKNNEINGRGIFIPELITILTPTFSQESAHHSTATHR